MPASGTVALGERKGYVTVRVSTGTEREGNWKGQVTVRERLRAIADFGLFLVGARIGARFRIGDPGVGAQCIMCPCGGSWLGRVAGR